MLRRSRGFPNWQAKGKQVNIPFVSSGSISWWPIRWDAQRPVPSSSSSSSSKKSTCPFIYSYIDWLHSLSTRTSPCNRSCDIFRLCSLPGHIQCNRQIQNINFQTDRKCNNITFIWPTRCVCWQWHKKLKEFQHNNDFACYKTWRCLSKTKETKDNDEYLDPIRQILLFSSLSQPTLLMKQSKQRQQEIKNNNSRGSVNTWKWPIASLLERTATLVTTSLIFYCLVLFLTHSLTESTT